MIISGSLGNRGRIEVEKGRLSLEGTSLHTGQLTVAAGAVARLGRQQSAEAEHRFSPASTVTGGGVVELGNATVVVEGAWQVGLTRVAGGILKFPAGRQLDRLEMAGGILRVDGGNGGSNGNDSGFGFELNGGEFIGVGLIEAQWFALRPFTNNAALRPGLPIGRLTFEYVNYAQTTNGVLEIEIGGRTPGTEFDQLQCGLGSRVKALAGTLEVKLVNNFVPAIGDRFLVVSGSLPNSNTRFTTASLPALPAGRRWLVNYLGGATPGVELQVAAGP